MPRTANGEFNQNKYINRFIKENYDRINLTVPAGKKELIQKKAARMGQSVNEYVRSLIENDLKEN